MARKRKSSDNKDLPSLIVEFARFAPVPMIVLDKADKELFANSAFAMMLDTEPEMLLGTTSPISESLLRALSEQPSVSVSWTPPNGNSRLCAGIRLENALGVVLLGESAPVAPDVIDEAVERLLAVESALKDDQDAMLAVREIIGLLTIKDAPFATEVGELSDIVRHVLGHRKRELATRDIKVEVPDAWDQSCNVQSEVAQGAINEVMDHVIAELAQRTEPKALRLGLSESPEGIINLRVTHNGTHTDVTHLNRSTSRYGVRVGVIVSGSGLGVTYEISIPCV
jgi:hypothetical protein